MLLRSAPPKHRGRQGSSRSGQRPETVRPDAWHTAPVSAYGPYDSKRAFGYQGGYKQKTDWCAVCDKRQPRGGGVTWKGNFVCAECAKTHRPVTFHATWSELLTAEEAAAISEGDVLEAPEWAHGHGTPILPDDPTTPGLPVTRAEERPNRYGHAPELHVYLSDRARDRD